MKTEMKDSGIDWIGEIPKHWETEKPKNMFSLRKTKGNKEAVLLAATQKFGMYPQNQLEGVVKVSVDTDLQSFKTVHKNDYVISLRSFQGGFEMSDYEGVCTPAYQVFFAKTPINHRYYKFLFKTEDFISKLNSFTIGIREGKNIQYDDFARLTSIPVPDIDEQSRIANFLDKKCAEIDELITLQEKMIAQLTTYKQAVITETVTKGLDPNVKMKDSGVEWIGEIPEHWSKDKIIRIFMTIGSGTTPKSTEDSNFEGTINWLQSGDINGNIVNESKNRISSKTLKEYSALKIYNAPFIIVAMYGASVGNISISEIDACVNQACCVMSNSNHDFKYLFYAIKSAKNYLIYRAVGGGQPNISQDTLKNLWLPNPSLSEQQSIANYLDQKCKEIDELISIKKEKIEQLKAYKKSVIYEYVTGKKQVEIDNSVHAN